MSDNTTSIPRGCLAPLVTRTGYYASLLAQAPPEEAQEIVTIDCNRQLAVLFCVLQAILVACAFAFALPRLLRPLFLRPGFAYPAPQSFENNKISPLPSLSREESARRQRADDGWPARFKAECGGIANALLLPTLPVVDLTIGQIGALGIYSALVIFIAVYQVGSWADNPTRFGFVAVSQVPATFILAMKNNPLAIIGFGYERVNFIHRFAGRMFLLFAVIHGSFFYNAQRKALGYIPLTGHLKTGTIVLVCASTMFVTGLRPIRRRLYQVFLMLHVAGYITILVALYYHDPATHPFLYAAFAAVGLDHVLKLLRTRLVSATLTSHPGQLTRIEVPELRQGWRAGQHVWIRVGEGRMVFEKHPFTVAGAEERVAASPGKARLVLVAKAAGDFTKRLHKLGQPRSVVFEGDFSEQVVFQSELKLSVEGPYGGTGLTRFHDFAAVLLVAGGSGVTFVMAMLDELVGAAAGGTGRTSRIVVLWTVRDLDMLDAFADQIARTLRAARRNEISVTFRLHVTSSSPSTANASNASNTYTSPRHRSASSSLRHPRRADLPEGVQLAASRPHLRHNLAALVDFAANDGEGGGVGVGVCGPLGLVKGCREAVREVDARHVGGVTLHSELFGW